MLKLAVLFALLVLGSEGRTRGVQQLNQPDMDTISQYIKMVLENLKKEMPKGFPELGIPPLDPLNIPFIDVPRIKEGIADVKLKMQNLNLNGLSTFRVDKAKGDLSNLGIELEIFIPHLDGKAIYDLDGKVFIFPLFGKGNAMLQVNDLKIKGKAAIGIQNMKQVQLTDFQADVSFSQVQIYLENIVGGGNLGDLVNTLLNMLGKLVYDKLKGVILPEINRIIKTAVNNELKKVDINDIIGGILPKNSQPAPFGTAAGNEYVDKLMEQLRPHILNNNLDPLRIPDQIARFSKKVLFVTVHGSARLTHGTAAGLSTIHRAGDCHFGIQGQTVKISCELGINNINGGFNARAEFMKIGVGANVRFGVSTVRVFFGVSAEIGQTVKPRLERFSINHVAPVGVSISGLGPLNWIANIVSNVVINAVKGVIVKAIENPIRHELNKVLESVKIPGLP